MIQQYQITHPLDEKPRVDQMQNGMLDAADVLVDREPIGDGFRVERRAIVFRVAVAVKIPGRIDERVHRVGLAPRGPSALGTLHVYELWHLFERRASLAGNLDI